MNTKDFLRLGVPLGQATRRATDFISKFILGGGDKSQLHEEVAAIVANPSAFVDDPLRGEFAKALLNAPLAPVFGFALTEVLQELPVSVSRHGVVLGISCPFLQMILNSHSAPSAS